MSFLNLPANTWAQVLPPYLDRTHMTALSQKVAELYHTKQVLPEQSAIFKALALTDYQDVKVVILGQDPYPNPENAMGLAFSVKPNVKVPASLQNIYKERYTDLGIPPSNHGDLTAWAKQGVLLLNTSLTVTAHESGSHANLGWTEFTDAVIKSLADRNQPIVYILWGAHAQAKEALLPHNANTLILKASHPSPFSARISFFGSKPFSITNTFLTKHGIAPIDWRN